MTGDDVPNDEMPNILRPVRRDTLPLNDAALTALLAGTEPPAEPAPGLRPVADFLALLRADPTSHELAGEARALAEFRRGASPPAVPRHPRHRRPRVLPARLGTKAAAAVGIAALGLGGLAAAAFVGVLPASVQRIANKDMGTHSATPSPPHRSSPGSPQTHHHRLIPLIAPATAPATHPARVSAHWQCAAYARAKAHGSRAQQFAAYDNLLKAARDAGGIDAYCGQRWPAPRPAHHTGGRIPPSGHDKRSPQHRDGQGIPPGDRSGQHSTHPNDKPSAHRAGRRGPHHGPHALGNGAQMTPTRHRAVPRSQLGRVGPRHRSEG